MFKKISLCVLIFASLSSNAVLYRIQEPIILEPNGSFTTKNMGDLLREHLNATAWDVKFYINWMFEKYYDEYKHIFRDLIELEYQNTTKLPSEDAKRAINYFIAELVQDIKNTYRLYELPSNIQGLIDEIRTWCRSKNFILSDYTLERIYKYSCPIKYIEDIAFFAEFKKSFIFDAKKEEQK